MAFKKMRTSGAVADSPDQFYNDVRPRRIQGLLAHQADILREYTNQGLDQADVAFQLPTGSGKTLVGIALAEWRRRKYGERVVYLCPNNQLVHQVTHQSRAQYGIQVIPFTGSRRDYPPTAQTAYRNAEAVAITSYSALFNTNPFFNNPHIIILDDAHAAENYIAAYWSLNISRAGDDAPVFEAVVAALRGHIPAMDYARLTGADVDPWSHGWVEQIPIPVLMRFAPELTTLLDEHVGLGSRELQYRWSVLRDHPSAWHMYYSAREILIRPLIPPTDTHPPFAGARQRVYMSATLGEGGDLERLTGRRRIVRLPIPPGWDTQGTGRRLFFMPESSLSDGDTRQLVGAMIQRAGRALYLVPSDRAAQAVSEWAGQLAVTIFDAEQIEESKDTFVQTPRAVAVVANRYDGIDLAEDECRLLIVDGLPRAVNLQEAFLVRRMNSLVLLNDRVRTRVVQAFGRCTRSGTDYAAVIVLGTELGDYLLTRERRDAFHPDLRAELEFGIEQSRNTTVDDSLENFELLLAQGQEWKKADEEILDLRKLLAPPVTPGAANLQSAAPHEVRYEYAMWNGNYEEALEAARAVLTELTAPELRGYRSLWSYLAGSAAQAAAAANPGLALQARAQFRAAAAATPAVRWLATLARDPADHAAAVEQQRDAAVHSLIERLEAELDRLGTHSNRRYDAEEAFIRAGLAANDADEFEAAHERLGTLLGFAAGNRNTQGAPDPWWMVDEHFLFIFEDHSDADPGSELSVRKARQAMSHPNWVRDNLPVAGDADIVAVLVSPVAVANDEALPHLHEVLYWSLDQFRVWAQNALSVVRELRNSFPGPGDVSWRDRAAASYTEAAIDPMTLHNQLKQNVAADRLRRQ
jgi:hypothetical protein